MKKKADKKKDIESLHRDLEQANNVFVTGYEKLRVEQDFDLRKAVRGAGGQYRVIKNNVAAIASEGTAAGQVLQEGSGYARTVGSGESAHPAPGIALMDKWDEARTRHGRKNRHRGV